MWGRSRRRRCGGVAETVDAEFEQPRVLPTVGRDGPPDLLRWVASMFSADPFIGVRFAGTSAVFVNDWRNLMTLDLADPDLI